MTFKMIRRIALLVVLLCVCVAPFAHAGQAAKTDVTGTWAFEVVTDAGGGSPTVPFKQDGEKLSGHYAGTLGEGELTGTLKGKDVVFSVTIDIQGQQALFSYKGTLESATSMKGTLDIAGLGSGTFSGTKKK